MPKGDNFKTLYKAAYSSQGTLANDILPDYVSKMLGFVALLEDMNPEAPRYCIGWLAAMMPPFKKYFKDYDLLMQRLEKCRTLRIQWQRQNKMQSFPMDLKKEIYSLYEKWWEAYNDSGAGIKGEAFDPNRDSKLYGYLTGKKIK